MRQVLLKFLEIDTAIPTISSMQAASSQTAPQLAPRTVPSATAQPIQDPWPAAAAHSRTTTQPGGTPTPQGGAPTAPSQETETPRRCSVDPKRWTDHRKLDLDLKPEGSVAWRDRLLGECATGHCSKGPEEPRYTTMSANATAVGGVAILEATGSEALMGGYVEPE